MKARLAAFTVEFMSKFKDQHAEAFPNKPEPPQYGYPDSGCGRYGKALPYAQWFSMNNGQRI
jgi:hypothetical protein